MSNPHSYHIFYFPFKWEIADRKDKLFSEQVDLESLQLSEKNGWERVRFAPEENFKNLQGAALEDAKDLYAEQNYYFDFVHKVLYDKKDEKDSMIIHYERRETKEGLHPVHYCIKLKNDPVEYRLKVDAINLNIYATGVGTLSFFLKNEGDRTQPEDIRKINQFGRRIMPPHYGELDYRMMISEYLNIEGLYGYEGKYKEDFSDYTPGDVWKPASFICRLIWDLCPEMKVIPVIDDRMFANCCYVHDGLVEQFKAEKCESEEKEQQKKVKKENREKLRGFVEGDFWYKYLFVDDGDFDSCQHTGMKKKLLKESTYYRWQGFGSLYGVSRYSFVLLKGSGEEYLDHHMRTLYSRMIELALVQRASMLRFSSEVTEVSRIEEKNRTKIQDKIRSLYKEYIRFVNQIYFREITAQDQGIELYNLLLKQFNSEKQIEDLQNEICELHEYISIVDEKEQNWKMEKLTLLATVFVPASIITGFFGMNSIFDENYHLLVDLSLWNFIGIIAVICLTPFILGYILKIIKNNGSGK